MFPRYRNELMKPRINEKVVAKVRRRVADSPVRLERKGNSQTRFRSTHDVYGRRTDGTRLLYTILKSSSLGVDIEGSHVRDCTWLGIIRRGEIDRRLHPVFSRCAANVTEFQITLSLSLIAPGQSEGKEVASGGISHSQAHFYSRRPTGYDPRIIVKGFSCRCRRE